MLTGQFDRKGKDARTVVDDATKWYADALGRHAKDLRTDEQRQALEAMVSRRRDRGLTALARHAATEHQNDIKLTLENTLDTAEADIRENPDSAETAYTRYAATVAALVTDGETRTALTAAGEKRIRLAAARTLVDSNSDRAQEYIERHKAVLGDNYHGLVTRIDTVRNRELAAQEKLLKRIRENAEQSVLDQLDAGDITGALTTIRTYGTNRFLSPSQRTALRSLAVTRRDESDPDQLYDIESKVIAGDITQEEISISPALGIKDKLRLLKLNKDDSDPRKSYEYREVYKSARNEISPTGAYGVLDPDWEQRFTTFKRALDKHVLAGGDPWEFYDTDAWKYRTRAVPETRYGTPMTVDDVAAFRQTLADDVRAGKLSIKEAKIEEEKLKHADQYFAKSRPHGKSSGRR
jgi:hypothetical protein